MKRLPMILGIVFVLIAIAPASAAATSVITATNPQDAAALVYVSGYEINPGVFYPYETGTVTVHVTNAANTSVSVSSPNLIDPHVNIADDNKFSTSTSIGPGATVDYAFVITVEPPDGTYFPLFTVSTNAYGGRAIHSQIQLKVDSTDVRASISKKPDSFSVSKKDTVNVSIVNPRLGDISDVLIIPSGDNAEISPSEKYVGTIPAGGSAEVPFQITPDGPTSARFNVSFRNGDNRHSVSVVLPVVTGEDKTAALPVMSDIAVIQSGSSYTMTGDVSNAGITDASGMILTTASPATPVEPYANYVIGSLNSNDFSSFTLTFRSQDLSSVPVIISWKDAEGNTFTTTRNLDLRSVSGTTGNTGSTGSRSGGSSFSGGPGGAGGPGGGGVFSFGGSRSGGISSFYPLIAGGIVVIIAIVLWMKRKTIRARFRKQ